jgi:hypothetical protein
MLLHALLWLALSAGEGHESNGGLPICGNAVINQVVKRVGCTLGDARCWRQSGGFCANHVEARVAAAQPGVKLQLFTVRSQEVRPGDVAVFAARAHYAYVEAVASDKAGRPVAVTLSEYNFGTCWVDRELLVTDQFKVVGRRDGVVLRDVDGGFLRPRPAAK